MKIKSLVQCMAGVAFLAASQSSVAVGLPVEDLDVQPGPVKNAGLKCSLKTLKGTYIFALGYLGPKGDQQEQSGIEYYDGKGNITGKMTAKLLPDQVYSDVPYKGTYELNPDCTGKTFNKDIHMADIFVSPDGKVITQTLVMKGYQGSSTTNRVTKDAVYGLLPTTGN